MKNIAKEVHNNQDLKTIDSVMEIFRSRDDISISIIQRKCNVGYNAAHRAFEKLVQGGVIEKIDGNYISKFV